MRVFVYVFKDASDRRLGSYRSFLHIMAENLTPWEKSQVTAIDKLIQKCQLRYFALVKVISLLDDPQFEMSEEIMSLRLRYFAIDLYSVLDYLCYLCYCHYKNNGNPSYSKEARNVKFPYKELKISDVRAMNDSCKNKTRKFVWDHFNTIFNNTGLQPGEFDEATPQLYKAFEELIVSCQVVTKVDGQGNPLVPQDPQDQRHEAKQFSALHFLRNTAVHRHLIDVVVENVWWYVDLQNGTHEFSAEEKPERINNPVRWKSQRLSKTCRLTLPSVCLDGSEARKEDLHCTIFKLLDFVKKSRNKLLRMVYNQIPEYNHDRMLMTEGGGVCIYRDENIVHNKTREQFNEICGIDTGDWSPWAV